MNTKVVITGSLGYLGSELLKQASKQNITCLPIDKEYQSRTFPRGIKPRGKDLETVAVSPWFTPLETSVSNVARDRGVLKKVRDQNRSEGLRLNLGDYQKTAQAIKNFKPAIFFHTGTHSALAYRDNFLNSFAEDSQALMSVLKSLRPMPNCKLIYFSSSYIYSGLPANKKVSENNPLKPNHNFGVAKSFFEQFILKNHPQSVIFRLSSVFGPGQAKNPNTILNFVKECQEKGKITLWGLGKRKIQYIYLKDVINCALKSLSLKPGIYNLGGDDYVSVADAAHSIANFYQAKTIFLKEKPEGETLPFLDNNKIKTALKKKKLFTPFATALTEYLHALK